MASSYFVSVLGRETLEDHSQLLKKDLKMQRWGGCMLSASSPLRGHTPFREGCGYGLSLLLGTSVYRSLAELISSTFLCGVASPICSRGF